MKYIKLKAYSAKHGLNEKDVIQKIRDGELVGQIKMGMWYVNDPENIDTYAETDLFKVEPSPTRNEQRTNKGQRVPKNHATTKKYNFKHYKKIEVTTLEYVPNKTIASFTMVSASVIKSKNLFTSFLSDFKSLTIGGKSDKMSNMMDDIRDEVIEEMQKKAHAVGADAVIGIRFVSAELMSEAMELMGYGTAVTYSIEDNDVNQDI